MLTGYNASALSLYERCPRIVQLVGENDTIADARCSGLADLPVAIPYRINPICVKDAGHFDLPRNPHVLDAIGEAIEVCVAGQFDDLADLYRQRPLAPWQHSVTGANPRSGQTPPTGSNGKTTISYVGSNPGRDTIQILIVRPTSDNSSDPDPDIDFFTEDVTVDGRIPFVTIQLGPQRVQPAKPTEEQRQDALVGGLLKVSELSLGGAMGPGSSQAVAGRRC